MTCSEMESGFGQDLLASCVKCSGKGKRKTPGEKMLLFLRCDVNLAATFLKITTIQSELLEMPRSLLLNFSSIVSPKRHEIFFHSEI